MPDPMQNRGPGHWVTVVDPITMEPSQVWAADNAFPQTGLSSPDNGDNEPNFGSGLPTQRPGMTFNSPDVGPMPTDISAPLPPEVDPTTPIFHGGVEETIPTVPTAPVVPPGMPPITLPPGLSPSLPGGDDVLPSRPTAPPSSDGMPGLSPTLGGSPADILGQIGKYAKLLRALGSAVGGATQQAAENRIAINDPYVQRGRLEMAQRNNALKQLYSADQAMHPSTSPFDPVPMQTPGPEYAAALKDIQGQDTAQLHQPPQYNTSQFPSLQPGTLEKIGQWLGPILSLIGYVPGAIRHPMPQPTGGETSPQ